MANRRTLRGIRLHSFSEALEPHIRLAGLVTLATLPILLVASLVPRTLVLPSLSLVAIAAAALAALVAWSLGTRRHGNTVTLWDIAGALMLIGCAAAMLSEPERILLTFDNL